MDDPRDGALTVTDELARSGPPHLAGLTEPAPRPANISERHWNGLLECGWAGRLRTPDGQTRFRLRYHGDRVGETVTEDDQGRPAMVYAVPEQGGPILLFDAAAHGYNALFCDTWDPAELAGRDADEWYVDADEEDTFELVVWVGYQVDYGDEDERRHLVDPDDPELAALSGGRRMPYADAAAAGFDAIAVIATNSRGRATDVVSEELA
ncbi:hypothetical protein [Micromonospora nigra]|uniref:hypothetical protein n=1 Tax=Micromonospora nigra TaxID=145857 RepID=UPI001112CC34|nr:hypothetical protein [Micromonospora nigra]